MPQAMFAIWWDDRLGPLVGRAYPESIQLSESDALTIFMSHGSKQKAKIGYTKIPIGLIVSIMERPNCIAVLLHDDEDPKVIERNIVRIAEAIDFNSQSWDEEIKKAYEALVELIDETTGESLLTNPNIKRLLQDLYDGRIERLAPKYLLEGTDFYPDASQYLGSDRNEVKRILQDLENVGMISAKTYGRRIECRQCGSSDVIIGLQCNECKSDNIHKVYTLFCPECSHQFHAVLVDNLTEVSCQHCKSSLKVSDLSVTAIEMLCNDCGLASEQPKIVLTCGMCGKYLIGTDLLAGTGIAYEAIEERKKDFKKPK